MATGIMKTENVDSNTCRRSNPPYNEYKIAMHIDINERNAVANERYKITESIKKGDYFLAFDLSEKLDVSRAEKLYKHIIELGLSEKSAIQIIDILPTDMIQLKQILANEKNAPAEDVTEKIFKLVEENRGKS